eukprot:1155922-Pelagomonas_calceolata.AAC.2
MMTCTLCELIVRINCVSGLRSFKAARFMRKRCGYERCHHEIWLLWHSIISFDKERFCFVKKSLANHGKAENELRFKEDEKFSPSKI